jgi:acyl-CoA thioesterase-2
MAAWSRYLPTQYDDVNAGGNADVASLLELDSVGADEFVNRHNQRNVNGMLFGGQVMAQALAAASATAQGRQVHSMHAYFLRQGVYDKRVNYRVQRLRNGRNFCTRRVIASQESSQILELSCSFFTPQSGFEHQMEAPAVAEPHGLQDLRDMAAAGGSDLPSLVRSFSSPKPFEVRPRNRLDVTQASGKLRRQFWWRVPSAATIRDPIAHNLVLAYMSDFWLNGAS